MEDKKRRAKRLDVQFRPGDWVELRQNVNAIPAGVYQLIDITRERLTFQIGDSVQFVIWPNDDRQLFRRAESFDAGAITHRIHHFVEKFYTLLESSRAEEVSFRLPLGCCFLAPQLLRVE